MARPPAGEASDAGPPGGCPAIRAFLAQAGGAGAANDWNQPVEWDRLIGLFDSDGRLPRLVLVGRPRPDRDLAAVGRDGRVHVLGQVDDAAVLTALYPGAACCVARSRFENPSG